MDVIALNEQVLADTYKRAPFVIERGKGVYLFDSEGRRYLDMAAGIAVNALGHGDAGIAKVVRAHADALFHVSNLYITRPQVELAQKLVNSCFADRVFFTNSGTEAVEGAFKFARKFAYETTGGTAKHHTVAFTDAFHGRSLGALGATANAKYRIPYEPLLHGMTFAPFNDSVAAEQAITEQTCAVIVEPVQGEGGITPATRNFLQTLRRRCDEVGALLIFDEIQCGMGRTGTLWAHEAMGVTPDMMVVAKPLGGGLPIGAILMTERVAAAMHVGEHGSTFAGGPFVTAVASHVFDRIANTDFLNHVNAVGNYLGEHLHDFAASEPAIVAVRGRGLMWGLELEAELPVAVVVAAAYEHGLLLVGAGRNTIRLLPPLIITESHVDELMDKLTALATALAIPA